MRHPLRALLPLLALAGLATPAPRAGAGDAPADPFVVHEWGTFTSVAGADGVGLEGLHHEEEALPAFVYDRVKIRACPLRAQGWKGLERAANHVTQKMETPVLYFHTKTARRARVRVDFVGGLISQWFPVTDTFGPPDGEAGAGRLDLRTVPRSFLAWDVDLLPRTEPRPAEVPEVEAGDPWAFARDVDAAWVRTRPREAPGRLGPVEAEHFLFYRGLGTFTLPFTATADAAGRLAFVNGSAHRVARAVAIEVEGGGTRGRHAVVCDLAPGASAGTSASNARGLLDHRAFEAWPAGGSEGMRGDLLKVLVGQGLREDEARAMIATWSRSWFATDGLRVLYVVPRPLVDDLLPLRIDPTPDRVVRVLLGRAEVLAPARIDALVAALAALQAASGPASPDAPAAAAALDRVLAVGDRFLEPALRRVVATTSDAAARAAASGLLGRLEAEDDARAREAR
ncbi:MAG: hypothetical protein JNM10_17215 [Planctomycetia bacterium]|nr:hypothetical protein [Planctomycetia bacterium]